MELYRDVYETNLLSCGFRPTRQWEREGQLFTVDSRIGKGFYWVYACGNLFAVSSMELSLYGDLSMVFTHTGCLCIGHYESVSGEDILDHKRLACPSLREYVMNGEEYGALYHSDKPIRGSSITLMPEFYEEYLRKKYPGEADGLPPLLSDSGDALDTPELLAVMAQIKGCRATGLAAKLYYESKVTEAVALILARILATRVAALSVSRTDYDRIRLVERYIEAHCGSGLRLEALAKLACMCPTKLKSTFKAVTRKTISQYINEKRMEKARLLLLETCLPVSEIAQRVGYKKAGAFARGYRATTGHLPRETRKNAMT